MNRIGICPLTSNRSFWRARPSEGSASGDASAKPIILDLDGDGVEVEEAGAVSFDWDDDGFRETWAWVGADDGLLVIGRNKILRGQRHQPLSPVGEPLFGGTEPARHRLVP